MDSQRFGLRGKKGWVAFLFVCMSVCQSVRIMSLSIVQPIVQPYLSRSAGWSHNRAAKHYAKPMIVPKSLGRFVASLRLISKISVSPIRVNSVQVVCEDCGVDAERTACLA